MENKFFEELSRRLREGGIESSNVEDKRLEVFLHGRPVLFVSPGHDAFLLPAGSQNQKASELYHRVAGICLLYTSAPWSFPLHTAAFPRRPSAVCLRLSPVGISCNMTIGGVMHAHASRRDRGTVGTPARTGS